MLPSSPNLEQHFDFARAKGTLPGRRFLIAGVELDLITGDASLTEEFASVFGSSGLGDESVSDRPVARLRAVVRSLDDAQGSMDIEGDDLPDPAAFLLGFASPTVPLVSMTSNAAGTQLIGIGDAKEPLFIFRGRETIFRKVERWQRIVSHVLFLRMLRMRSDLLFFHAASVVLGGKGFLFVGPKGTGKSTLSLALAARGHAFLGDETAAYEPGTRRLLPMRRPVGIKPGIRSRSIDQALLRLAPASDLDGMFRVPIERLLTGNAAVPAELGGVVFLRGFGPQPQIARIAAGREELSQMQPLRSTTAANATMRVFEMIRLLSSVACRVLIAGAPDETAAYIEEAIINGNDRS